MQRGYNLYATTKIDSLLEGKQNANSDIIISNSLTTGTDFTIGTSLILTTVVEGEIVTGVIEYNSEYYGINCVISANNNIVFDNGTMKIRQYINDDSIPVISMYDSGSLVTPSGFEGSVIRKITA